MSLRRLSLNPGMASTALEPHLLHAKQLLTASLDSIRSFERGAKLPTNLLLFSIAAFTLLLLLLQAGLLGTGGAQREQVLLLSSQKEALRMEVEESAVRQEQEREKIRRLQDELDGMRREKERAESQLAEEQKVLADVRAELAKKVEEANELQVEVAKGKAEVAACEKKRAETREGEVEELKLKLADALRGTGSTSGTCGKELADCLEYSVEMTRMVGEVRQEQRQEREGRAVELSQLLKAAIEGKQQGDAFNKQLKDALQQTSESCQLSLSAQGSSVAQTVAAVNVTALLDTCRTSQCSATADEMAQYMNYTEKQVCPDDWFFVQHLIFNRNCFSLPRRLCFARNFTTFKEPLPLPDALWNPSALMDSNVNWNFHKCKNFTCLKAGPDRARQCQDCFNFGMESYRWRGGLRGTISMEQVMLMKNGTLRIGLDLGGGSGSFAAKMAAFNVTVITTAFDYESISGEEPYGVPYMEAIAARGLVPLHLPYAARLPLFDNSIDIIHAGTSFHAMPLAEFEESFFDWDRVLRPGGLIWFNLFYAQVRVMPQYMAIVEQFKYQQLHWAVSPKLGPNGLYVHVNFVIEKPRERDVTPKPVEEILE